MAAAVKTYEFLKPPTQSGDMGTLGHYRVISELGKGGMGFVFRAEDIKLKRSVALKVMNQKIAATPHSRRRFIHEARAMAAVHHDNVATIFEVGESNNTTFMAMEMLKGSTLETFNKSDSRLGFEEIIDYARQMARGLSAAHEKGIVHRDIKPANIWIEEGTNRIKILDFGLALASTPVDHLAGRGAVIGTPGYLSPEQARSEPLDDRSDLYSMGVVLYELCTGQLPIQSKSISGQLISILAHRPTPIRELNPDIPQPLCDVIQRMLRKEPRSRPSSAAALAEDLDRVENECHAKSEVAQAINKLQAGLSEVVSKSSNEALFDTVAEIQETIPDPLALPEPLAADPAPVVMSPTMRPVGTAKSAAPAAAPAWVNYWPIAAIGALVLLALPIMTFLFSGQGRGDVAYVVPVDGQQSDEAPGAGADDALNAQGPSSQGPTAQGTSAKVAQPKAKTGAAANQSGNKQGANKQAGNKKKKNQGGGQKNRGNQGNRNRNNRSANNQSQQDGAKDNAKMQNSDGQSNTLASSVVPVTPPTTNPSPPAPKSQPEPVPETKPEPTAAESLPWTTITTRDGRGADVMVQSGSSQKTGNKPSIGVATRKGIETNHSYLRFDLKPIEHVIGEVQAAGIVLTLVPGRDEPIGSVVRVHGIADLGMWPEQSLVWRNSFSIKGLESLTLLGEATISEGNIVRRDGRIELRITGPNFAKFIAASSKDTVTMVLSGSGPGPDLLRFVSRESQADRPPRLLVQAPKEATKKKRGGGNRSER